MRIKIVEVESDIGLVAARGLVAWDRNGKLEIHHLSDAVLVRNKLNEYIELETERINKRVANANTGHNS